MNKKNSRDTRPELLAAMTTAFLATLLGMPVQAALTIPVVPPSSGNGVPPNIMFILDDSGSMTWQRMPVNGNGLPLNFRSRSYVHNTIYYDPRIIYRPWRQADGIQMTGGTSYSAVYPDFSTVGGDTIDLHSDSSCKDSAQNGTTFSVCGGTQYFYVPKDMTEVNPGYLDDINNYYRYRILMNGTVQQCTYDGSGWTGCANATPTGRSQADELTNYATWFSYHRTRMKAAKAGASYAFNDLDEEKYRVGFTTIWDRNTYRIPVGSNNGLFADGNRAIWFQRLFNAAGSSTTPLIPALTRAGEYFEESGSDGPYGPESSSDQFICRQNFAILTTDGYWNSGSSSVGNADGTAGFTINGPNDATYQYTPSNPYQDSWSNTLADIAMYYWKRDLRPTLENRVPASSANPAFWQHMVTFGVSIGERGTLDPQSDLTHLTNGTTHSQGYIGWPNPTDNEDNERIDDLWHASVNGRGSFVEATDPDAFTEGLRDALATIVARTSSSSNVAANSTSVGTDTLLYQAGYVGVQWTGELKALKIVGRDIIEEPPVWRASTGIPAHGSRKVFTYTGTAGQTFPTATQLAALNTAPVSDPDNAAEVVSYLKGDDSGERENGGPFRDRVGPLGDIIHSSPAYMKETNTVYVGANDGMLHAFNAADGKERFAYVPSGVAMSDLRELSNPNYAHRYFVDGPVTVTTQAQTPDRNILVGTLGRGGKGLFALDVTDTDTASFTPGDVMWDQSELQNTWAAADMDDLGLLLGRPFVVKLNSGHTGVVVGNGVNSTNEHAVLFVLDVDDGSVLAKLDTQAAGNNGLSAPRGWDADGNGTVDFVYAGDLNGNLWKFDLSDSSISKWRVAHPASGGGAPQPMFVATDAGGNRQPITGGVTLAIDPATYKQWVFFGTGRYLTDTDPADKSVQSMYGLIDDGARVGTRAADLVRRTTVAVGTINGRTVRGFEPSDTTAIPADKKGWFVDFAPPAPGTAEGERMIGDPAVVASVLQFSSIIPSDDLCEPGGRGFINAINPFTGASVSDNFFDVDGDGQYTDDNVGSGDNEVPVGSVDTGVGMNTDGLMLDKIIGVGGSQGNTGSVGVNNPVAPGRVSWRELLGD